VKISWQYAVGSRQKVKIDIYNCQGNLVDRLPTANCLLPTEVIWDASGHPSGIYIARIQWGGKRMTRQLVLMK
jgi:hypothetical protein